MTSLSSFCFCLIIKFFFFVSNHFVQAIFIGGIDVEKMNDRALFIRKLIIVLFETANAPKEPRAFPKVAVTISTSSPSEIPAQLSSMEQKACASTEHYIYF